MNLEDENHGHAIRRDAPSSRGTAVALAVYTSLIYTTIMFVKVPIFILPMDPSNKVFGFDSRTLFAISQIAGYAMAKPFAAKYIAAASAPQRNHMLMAISIGAAAFMGGGVAIFNGSIVPQALCVFPSAFVSSAFYALLLTYVEGRHSSDAVASVLYVGSVAGGGMARAAASFLLSDSIAVSPHLVPLILCGSTLPVALGCTVALSKLPPPSSAEMASQGKRGTPLSSREQFEFVSSNAFGLIPLVVFYALLSGFRGFRDFYADDIYASSASSGLYLSVDLPGGVLSALMVSMLVRVSNNRKAFMYMYVIMLMAVGLLVVATVLHSAKVIVSDVVWFACLGIGTYVAYAPVCTSMYDRLMAAHQAKGTCSFLLIYSDLAGYIGSLLWLFLFSFSEQSALEFFSTMTIRFCVLSIVLLVVSAVYFERILPRNEFELVKRSDEEDELELGELELEEQESEIDVFENDE